MIIIEVRGNGYDSLAHLRAQVVFGRLAHLLEDYDTDFGWAELLVFRVRDCDLNPAAGVGADLVGNEFLFLSDLNVFPAHEPLDGEDRILRIRDRLAARYLTYQTFTVFRECHDRWGRPPTF